MILIMTIIMLISVIIILAISFRRHFGSSFSSSCSGSRLMNVAMNVAGITFRWDAEGFAKWCNDAQVAWVRVGYLRKLARERQVLRRRQEIAPECLVVGAPPDGVQLHSPSQKWASCDHVDPEGFYLTQIVATLDKDESFDDDLLWMDFTGFFQKPRSPKEEELFKHQLEGINSMYVFYRIKAIILGANPYEKTCGFWRSMWTVFEFCLSLATQRIVIFKDTPPILQETQQAVEDRMKPETLLDIPSLLQECFPTHDESDKPLIIKRFRNLSSAVLKPARTDALGFQTVCATANFRWIFVSFIHELAERGGPAPRRQDLPPGAYIDGILPDACQPWVTTYGWAAMAHFSPSGAKIRELSAALRELGAAPTDVAFLDFMSLWQVGRALPAAYAAANGLNIVAEDGMVTLPEATPEQQREFRFALFETTRLYAFKGGVLPSGKSVLGCKVLVLPKLEDPHGFPSWT